MAKSKHVKLGTKASSFYDPSTGLKLSPGIIHLLSDEEQVSKKVKNAIKGGHLEYAEQEEIEAYEESLNNQNVTDEKVLGQKDQEGNEDDEDDEDDDSVYTEESLKSKSKEGLVNILIALNEEQNEDDQLSEADIKKMNKAELAEAILDLQDSEEE